MKRLLQHWLTEQAMKRPEAPAVQRLGRRVTYEELERQSNQLAHVLKEAGCRQGDRVCFLMPKCIEAVISIMGILKADCIYVPLDRESPAIRTAKIIKKSRPSCIIAAGDVQNVLLNLAGVPGSSVRDIPIGWLGAGNSPGDGLRPVFNRHDLATAPDTLPACKNGPEDAAHLLFTSGSTGEPKGVITKHSNDIAFVEWAVSYFDIGPSDRLSSHTPMHFDLSTLDIYGTLSAGAQLHIIPAGLNLIPGNLARFIREYELTQWFSVPSILNYMSKFDVVEQGDFPSLKRLIWCGEVLPVPALRYWMERLPHATFTNLYGPTETTVASSYYTVPEVPESNQAEIPIGLPCEGEQLHVLDEELNPVPVGEIGDLYISGVGLSKGYWDDPERTSEVFLSGPPTVAGGRTLYKTGDLARIGEDGLCYFHGRVDNQIKSRGYRIELGEIESTLNSLQLTVECAIVAVPTEGFEGQAICCAYVPPAGGRVNAARLKKELKNLLPGYMIPHLWESYTVLPKNKNGKINRKEIKSRFQHSEVRVNA